MRALESLVRIAELSLETARQAGSLAVSVARTVADPVLNRHEHDGSHHATTTPPPPPATPAPEREREQRRPERPRSAATAAATPAPAPAPARPTVVAAPYEPAEPEPDHVDREAVVVAESADADAADGAGAQIRVDEPWDGYRRLNAKDVVAQLATADAATLAVVRLYETAHRNRRTVLAEIDRRLVTGGG